MADPMMADNLDHSNLQAQAFAIIFAFPCIATISLALRLYSRSLTKTFAADDWFICFAALLYWAETWTSYKLIRVLYIGYHLWDIPPPPIYDPVLGGKYSYITQLLYNPILALVKTSILLFLLRLTGQKTSVRRSIWALLILNWAMMVVVFLLTTLQCLPIPAMWNRAAYPDAKCLNFADFVTGTASVSIVTDGLVLILPTWIVYNLQINRKQKMMLIGILSFGLVTFISGVVRMVLLDSFDRHPPEDINYSLLFCLSTIEIGLSFVAACAPSLRPIVVKVVPKIFGSRSGRYGRTKDRPSRLNAYELNSRSRGTNVHTNTEIEAAPIERNSRLSGRSGNEQNKNGIVMTTETEIRWDESAKMSKNGSSTESLV